MLRPSLISAALAIVVCGNVAVSAAEIKVPRQPGLPAEAEALLAEFETDASRITQQTEAQILMLQTQAIARLQAIQEKNMRAADLEAALAVRDLMRRLGTVAAYTGDSTPRTTTMLPHVVPAPVAQPAVDWVQPIDTVVHNDPGSLRNYRGFNGRSFYFRVVGSHNAGGIWGDNPYTDDSTLSIAAVHAGLVEPGKLAVVKVTILPGQATFQGSTQHGVTSSEYGEYGGSYRIEADDLAAQRQLPQLQIVEPTVRVYSTDMIDPQKNLVQYGSLVGYRGRVGEVLYVQLTGQVGGSVWGVDHYTDDSFLPSAAVHAGAVKPGERAVVKVTIEPGEKTYLGSSRNNVNSDVYGEWNGTYHVERVDWKAVREKSPKLELIEVPPIPLDSLHEFHGSRSDER